MKMYVYAENMLCEPSRLAWFGGEKLKLHRIHNDETYFPFDKTFFHYFHYLFFTPERQQSVFG